MEWDENTAGGALGEANRRRGVVLHCGHFATFFRTLSAGLGTSLAMVVFMPFTFPGTGIADICAKPAELFGPAAAKTH